MVDTAEELAASQINAAAVNVPAKLKAVVKFGYDKGMKDKLGSVDFMTWITPIMTHTQAHYKHSSLGTQIEFEVCHCNLSKCFS